MEKFEALIESLILPLLSFPDALEISNQGESDGFNKFICKIDERDFGRVIGKNGRIATAIRTILYAKATKEGVKVHLDIEAK
jgi:predicted RNA-binding protein YlqC (UPF0109 family)